MPPPGGVDNLHRCGLARMVGASALMAVASVGQSVQECRASCRRRRARMCVAPESSGDRREAYLSAQHPPPSPQAWLPCAYEHPRRPCGAQVPPRQGPRPTVGLIDRIRHRDAFARLRREGIRVRVDSLWCSFVPDSGVAPPRVAFAIGRAAGSAVQRNRLRRRLRAILGACDVPAGLLLIGADRAATEHSFAELQRSVQRLLDAMHRRTAAVSP